MEKLPVECDLCHCSVSKKWWPNHQKTQKHQLAYYKSLFQFRIVFKEPSSEEGDSETTLVLQ